jgi:hypothetical protein
MANEIYREPFGPVVLSFWFMIFFNLQSFGEGLDFCFDASKEGGFLTTFHLPKLIKTFESFLILRKHEIHVSTNWRM